MDCAGFWTRVERPLPTCSSQIRFPLRRAAGADEECTCTPPESPHDPGPIDDMESRAHDYQSNSPTSNMWDPPPSELMRPAELEGQNDEPNQEFEVPADCSPVLGYPEHERSTESTTREPLVVGYPANKSKISAFKKIRRVHFSLKLKEVGELADGISQNVAIPEESNSSDCHDSGRISDRQLDGVMNCTSKFGACSTFPLAPPRPRSCRPWNYNFARDLVQFRRRRDDSFKLDNQPRTCILGIRQSTNLPEPQGETPMIRATAKHTKLHAPAHPVESTSCNRRFGSIELQAEALHSDTSERETPQSLVTTCPTRVDYLQDPEKREIPVQPEPIFPKMESNSSPNDTRDQSLLRNCAALLRDLEPNQLSTTIIIKAEKSGCPPQHLRISDIHVVDKLTDNCFESVAALPETTWGCDVTGKVHVSRFDARDATNASRHIYEPYKEMAKRTTRPARARNPFPKFRKGGNKTPKSLYWFDVPYTSDADLPDGLLERLQRRVATPDSEPLTNVGNKISTSSDRFDKPSSADAHLSAGLFRGTVATLDLEPAVDAGSKISKSSYGAGVLRSADADHLRGGLSHKGVSTRNSEPVADIGNTSSNTSRYWFDVPHSTDANLPPGLTKRGVTIPDSEPLVDLGIKPSKISCWFDVPRSSDADDLPAGLVQKRVATPDSERAVDVGSKPSERSCWFAVPYTSDSDQRAAVLLQKRVVTPDSETKEDVDSKPSESSCWFGVPNSTDADLPTQGLLQKRAVTPDLEAGVHVDSKPSKSSCWFDVPYSTDANLPTQGLLQKRVLIPDSDPAVDVCSKPSKRSCWSNVPNSVTLNPKPNLPAGLLKKVVATPGSEPVVKTPKNSYWFDVPYATIANLPACGLQRRVKTRDSKPSVNLLKTSKSSYWFDVPYSTETDLPSGLLQKLRAASPDSESVADLVSTRSCFGLGRRVQAVGNVTSSPELLALAQPESKHGKHTRPPVTGKVYPGEFCPSFMLCPGDIILTRNLRTEQSLNKIDGHVTLFPDPRYFEENDVDAASSSGFYQFTLFDMVLRFGQFINHDDWTWVPSPSFSLFMYVPPEHSQRASWWLVDSKLSVELPTPDHNLDPEVAFMPLNSRLQLAVRNTDLVISTIPEPGLACKKRWEAHWGESPFSLPLTQDVLIRACYDRDSSHNPNTETTLVTVELYSYCGGSLPTWRFLGRDTFCYGQLICPP